MCVCVCTSVFVICVCSSVGCEFPHRQLWPSGKAHCLSFCHTQEEPSAGICECLGSLCLNQHSSHTLSVLPSDGQHPPGPQICEGLRCSAEQDSKCGLVMAQCAGSMCQLLQAYSSLMHTVEICVFCRFTHTHTHKPYYCLSFVSVFVCVMCVCVFACRECHVYF